MASNSPMLPMFVLLACCCCSSSASGAGAYFLGYVPGNNKYYTRIFQLEKMFQILEDIKKDMVYEGNTPTEYTGKIEKDFCDKIKDFKENLDEKRKDESEKVSATDFKKLVKTYMDDNEIKGYTSKQATDIIDFLYASCGTDDKRVFKKTTAFTEKLTKLFGMVTPTTNTFTAQTAFCEDVTGDDDVVTKGFKSLHKEIVTDVSNVTSLSQMWDGDAGTLVPSGFSLTDLTSSVDYCETPIAAGCVDNIDSATCTDATNDPQCVWTADVMSTDGLSVVTEGSCSDIPKCNTFMTNGSVPSATTDCPTRCEWTAGIGSAAGTCGPKTT